MMLETRWTWIDDWCGKLAEFGRNVVEILDRKCRLRGSCEKEIWRKRQESVCRGTTGGIVML